MLAVVAGIGAAVALAAAIVLYATKPLIGAADCTWSAVLPLTAGGMAYGFVRAVGMIVVGIYGSVRDGPELIVDWRAFRHDIRLRRTWIVMLEGGLLLAAACTSLWGLLLFFREGQMFGLAVFLVIQCMTYWPLIRRRISATRPSN